MTYNQSNSDINNIIFNGILNIIEKNDNTWSGTMTQLNEKLSKVIGKSNSSLLPGSPSALRIALNKVVNRIRNRGVSVRFNRTAQARFVKFSK